MWRPLGDKLGPVGLSQEIWGAVVKQDRFTRFPFVGCGLRARKPGQDKEKRITPNIAKNEQYALKSSVKVNYLTNENWTKSSFIPLDTWPIPGQ